MAQEARPVSLTGVKPTGEPHLGNYVGAIRPAIRLTEDYDAYYFIADYHALTSVHDPKLLDRYSRSVAASWIACGLDPEVATFYRQSDIPETFELSWILSCFTPKGLMNRAHAYKAARDRNQESNEPDLDAGVNMGLYNYPVLMDGGQVSAPRVAFRNPQGELDVENKGVAPDVEVDLDPQIWRAGRDVQLEKAVEVTLAEIKKNPVRKPVKGAFPNYQK